MAGAVRHVIFYRYQPRFTILTLLFLPPKRKTIAGILTHSCGPLRENEPYLSSAFEVLLSLRARLQSDYNFNLPQIYWLGFSQGACLALEFTARNATEYGGIFGLSGGLIGPPGSSRNYEGSFANTPVFIGCSDRDSHIPQERVLESERVFREMGANANAKLYPNFSHSINEDELNIVNLLIAGDKPSSVIT